MWLGQHQQDERSCCGPFQEADVKELATIRCDEPGLAAEHGVVGEATDCRDVAGAEEERPLLVRSFECHHCENNRADPHDKEHSCVHDELNVTMLMCESMFDAQGIHTHTVVMVYAVRFAKLCLLYMEHRDRLRYHHLLTHTHSTRIE
jgi:hypothetical protein